MHVMNRRTHSLCDITTFCNWCRQCNKSIMQTHVTENAENHLIRFCFCVLLFEKKL